MGQKMILEIELKGDDAEKELKRIQKAIEKVQEAAEDATEETKGLGEEVGESGAAISLLDAATGGLASRVRDVAEVYKTFKGRITSVTAAQIKANLAFLANPIVLVTAAVVSATGAFAKFASKMTDDVVPVGETLKNMFFSLGNAADFARRQAESYTKNVVEQDSKRFEQAIAIARAYGEDTLELELELARRRFAILKEGDEGYVEAQTAIAVIRANIAMRDVAITKAAQEEKTKIAEKAAAEEEARVKKEFADRQAVNKEVEKGYKLQGEALETRIRKESLLQAKGLSEGLKEYQATRIQEKRIDEVTAQQKLQLASQTFGALAGILGQNSKVGKAAGIAQAIINTYQGVTEVLKNPTTIPEPFGTIQKIASTATVLASGFQAVRAMQQTPIPVIAAGGGFGGGGGAGVAVSAPPQINTVGASSINQLAQTISGQTKEPVRAYVVAGDVTSAQSLERNTIKEASI